MFNEVILDVIMTTYNQEKYIANAIESVIAQKTNFPFRLIIGEDCSTDSTLSICKKYVALYPQKIILIQNEKNVGLIQNYLNCFELISAKYIAILEGDDFWIDNFKLQSQVDILESKPSVGLVYSNYKVFNEQNQLFSKVKDELIKYSFKTNGYSFGKLLCLNHICAATVVFQSNLISNIDKYFLKNNQLKTIDYYLWLHISYKSKIYYLNKITSVYRVSNASLSNSSDFKKSLNFIESTFKISDYFIDKYAIEGKLKKIVNDDKNFRLFVLFIKQKKLIKAAIIISSLRIKPLIRYILNSKKFK